MRSCYVFAAKAARRRGGQPRLAPMQGRPPTARPRLSPFARGLPAAARASLQGRSALLAGAAARRGNSGLRAHPLAARRPQGAVASRGGGVGRRGGCRRARTVAPA
ncbi:hypothetical protein B296_00043825 [Ensete ventricosum]|uniref:Uncharacterized protein n=1 Tax=Ensete ventricosum TaxID=4639 RepID=A0A426XPD9_ENSVE|nr:hypothetical protein B296_00043825 [Ensete ventricosum]